MFDIVATEHLIIRWYFNQLTCRALPCPGVYHEISGMEATEKLVWKGESLKESVYSVCLWTICGRWQTEALLGPFKVQL